MKKVLYISNIEVPYRVRFFNQLAEHCDLTVLYEREKSENRDDQWASSEKSNYTVHYLNGIKIGNENSFSFQILKHVFSQYDAVIIGCYNSYVQMMAILAMRLLHRPYYLNIDGEVFLEEKSVKTRIKKLFLRGATGYLAAGEKSAESLRKVIGDKPITVYYFSSLTEEEIRQHASCKQERNKKVLVVGQYFEYKGMDIAVEVARKDPERQYVFVGMGKRTAQFVEEQKTDELANVEVIPFLQKKELEELYQQCAMLLLPSRQECWGLVINEAASYGMPIVSTWGSGAAVEFLKDGFPECLAKPESVYSLLRAIAWMGEGKKYISQTNYLLKVSRKYSIEAGVRAHIRVLGMTSGK